MVEIPKEIIDKTLEAVELAANSGKIKKGINEVTKAVEREKAELVIIAGDVSPKEIVMHIPLLCDEKKIAYLHVPTKQALGDAVGLKVPSSAVAIVESGDGKVKVEEIKKMISELRK